MLLHLPAHPECDICKQAKISKKPARRSKTDGRVTVFGMRFYLDLIGPMPACVSGHVYLLSGRDEATDYAIVQPLKNKAGVTVTTAFKRCSHDMDILCVRPDWGKEFQGPFEKLCKRRNIHIEKGLPRRSQNFSREERWHRTLEEGVRSALLQSNFSHGWYSWCSLHWTEHWNCISSNERPSPFSLRYGKECVRDLRPFGSLVFYLKEKPSAVANIPKFEPRGDAGLVIGYGAYSSIVVLLLTPFVQHGKRLFRRTRDYKVPTGPPRFPLKEIMSAVDPSVEWHFLLPCEQKLEQVESLPEGVTACDTCGWYITSLPVSCTACLQGPITKRIRTKTSFAEHTNDYRCNLCKCTCMSVLNFPEGVEVAMPAPNPVDDHELEANSTLTDLAYGELTGIENLHDLDGPESVADGFVEPDGDGNAPLATVLVASHTLAQEAHHHQTMSAYEECIRLFFNVYKAVPLKSDQAKSPGALKAIAKEIQNMESNSVFASYTAALEMSDLRASNPEALVVFAHLLLGLKGIEIGEAIWKARLVAGGNRLLDGFGVHFRENDLHGAPTSLEVIRIIVWWSTMSASHTLLQADVSHAYLQAKLRGRAVYVVLPRCVWPECWYRNGLPIFKFPCLRLHRAMYGLRRSGFDWLAHAERILISQQWIPIRDYCDSLFVRPSASGLLMMALYVDDLLAAGPAAELAAALDELRGV